MAYIDTEAFKQKLIEKGFFPAIVQRALEEMPSEDVAPKSEVAREIFEEIEKIIDNNTYKSYLPNSSLWCKEYRSNQIIVELAELKKKYTEGEK